MRSYITAQFKYQPAITRNTLQRTKERKFMYKIGFETTDTVILGQVLNLVLVMYRHYRNSLHIILLIDLISC